MDQVKPDLSMEDLETLAERTGLPLLRPGSLYISDTPVEGPGLRRPPREFSDDLSELEDAIDAGDAAEIEAILVEKPDLNRHYGPYHGFPLLWAMTAPTRSPDIIAQLVKHGADPRFATPDGFTALHYLGGFMVDERATELRQLIKLLLDAGADIDARSATGLTPLMRTIHEGHHGQVAALLDMGADPDAPHPDTGRTPLMMAMRRPGIVELLLDCGADPSRLSPQGEDALAMIKARLEQMPKGPSRFRRSLGAQVDPEREALELSLELLVQA